MILPDSSLFKLLKKTSNYKAVLAPPDSNLSKL